MILSEKSFAREASSATDIYSSTDSANSDSNGAEESVLISEMVIILGTLNLCCLEFEVSSFQWCPYTVEGFHCVYCIYHCRSF